MSMVRCTQTLCLLYCNYLLTIHPSKGKLFRRPIPMKRILLFFGLLTVITSAAFTVRFFHIESIPTGIYPDEAVNGTDALRALDERHFRLFYENNNGREGLFINIQALSLWLLGNSVLALKLPAVFFGTLTVIFTGFLSRELFRSRAAGLIAAGLTGFSYWAVNFSRIGFRANATPFFLASSFYFFFLGLRVNKRWPIMTSGALFGLGFHTYIAYRMAPFLLVFLLILILFSRWKTPRHMLSTIGFFSVFALVTAAPMAYDFLRNPQHLSSRANAISILSPEVNKGKLFPLLSETVSKSITKYVYRGDENWRHNLPPYPLLDPLAACSFLLGIAVMMQKSLVMLKKRIINGFARPELIAFPFLLAWMILLLAPEFLAHEGNPHALRSIGTLPAVYAIATYPLLIMWRRLHTSGHGLMAISAVIVLLLYASCWNMYHYFITWARSPQSHAAFEERYTRIGLFLKAADDDTGTFVIANGRGQLMDDGLPVSAHVIKYITYRSTIQPKFISPDSAEQTFPQKSVVVLMDKNPWIADMIVRKNPNAFTKNITPYEGAPGDSSFSVVFIPEKTPQ